MTAKQLFTERKQLGESADTCRALGFPTVATALEKRAHELRTQLYPTTRAATDPRPGRRSR